MIDTQEIIYVSDSITDSVDMGQFYDNNTSEEMTVQVCGESIISGKVLYIKTIPISNNIEIRFRTSSESASKFVLDMCVESVEFLNVGHAQSRNINNLSIVSKTFKVDDHNRYECELIAKITHI